MSIIEEVEEHLSGYPGEEKQCLEDLQKHGCVSGMINSLCYYTDTVKFYEENRDEINNMLADVQKDMGEPVLHKFRGYDEDDPLCLNELNQNMLAWWGFEEVAFKVYTDKYEE